MATDAKYDKAATRSIREKLRLLSQIVILIIAVLLLVFLRFLYTFLDYIPLRSVQALLLISAGLGLLGFLLFRAISANAVKAIEDYGEKLSALLATTKSIHEIRYSDMIFENVMDVSLRTTGAAAGSIALVEGENLILKLIKGGETKNLKGLSFPRSKGLAGWVAVNGSAIRLQDAGSDSRFDPEVDMITIQETKSALCVPLRSGKGVTGTIELVNKINGPFTAEDEEFISYFADQAAVSIERAKFFEDERNYEIHLTNILIDAMENMPEKKGHSRRVAHYALLTARALNMSDSEKKKLYHAALLHDIGFLKIRRDTSSLEELREHSKIGYEMLLPINFYSDVASCVLHHHERYDGRGYPSGLAGKSIPLESRIIFIAEVFDAIVSENSYRNIGKIIQQGIAPLVTGFQGAVEELRSNAGTQFDPELVEVFVNNISEDYIEK